MYMGLKWAVLKVISDQKKVPFSYDLGPGKMSTKNALTVNDKNCSWSHITVTYCSVAEKIEG